jgi:hypothetical protein
MLTPPIQEPGERVATASDGFRAVRLPDVDPDLVAGLSESELAEARRHLRVPALRLAPGLWTPPEALHRAMGAVIASGMVMRHGTSFARPDIQLFGAGDVVDGRMLAERDSRGTSWRRSTWPCSTIGS